MNNILVNIVVGSRITSLIILAFVLNACGGGGGASTDSTGTGSGDAGTGGTTPTSFDNMVVLYIRPPQSSNSDYLPGYDITLESNKEYLFRYIPDLDKADLLMTHDSPSWAPSSIFPYSTDDRVLVRREWRPFEIGGHHDFRDYTVNDFTQTDYFDIRDPYYFSQGCSAVAGDYYYFESYRNWDSSNGWVGGDFYRYQISTGTSQKLISYRQAGNCYGELMSDGGVLYDVYVTPLAAPTNFYFYRRNLTTGLPETPSILNLYEANSANFNSYRFSVSGGTFYMARRRVSDGFVEVWRQQFSPVVEPEPIKIIDQDMGPLNSLNLDVDDSHLMVATNKGFLVLFNTGSRFKQQIDLGIDVTEIVQVFVKSGTQL